MDLTYIIVLAAMVFVLSAMVGYLYWQQTVLFQRVNSLSYALGSHLNAVSRPAPDTEVEVNDEDEAENEVQAEVAVEDIQETEIPESEEDDRVSVENVSGPPPEPDVDDIQAKTTKQLQELLIKKGIPFGKRDSKTTLLELLKATA